MEHPAGGGGVLFWVLLGVLAVGGLGGAGLRERLDPPAAVQAWATVFVSVTLQSLPFLVLGVALSAAMTVWLPTERVQALLPSRPAAAVPVAGLSGGGAGGLRVRVGSGGGRADAPGGTAGRGAGLPAGRGGDRVAVAGDRQGAFTVGRTAAAR